MSKTRLPAGVDGGGRPESGEIPPGQFSELVEIAKRSGDFSAHYGKWWGGFIQLCLANAAAGRRPFLWGALISVGTVIGGLMLKYGPVLGKAMQ